MTKCPNCLRQCKENELKPISGSNELWCYHCINDFHEEMEKLYQDMIDRENQDL